MRSWGLVLGMVLLSCRPALSQGLQSQHVVGQRGQITISDGFYVCDGLRIEAHLFMPHRVGNARLPGIVYAHDGVHGLSRDSVKRCTELARSGYVVIAPSYRGEDASQGIVEVAAGEVNDVLAAARLLSHLPNVDPTRIGAIGTSHGALIVVLAAEQSHLFKAVVEGYGVMDIYSWWRYLKNNHFSTDDPLSRRVYGNGPQDRPQAFARRDAMAHVADIQTPVLIIQGGVDRTVPPQQAEEFAKALQAAGKPYEILRYPTEEHGFLIYPGDPASNRNREAAWAHIRQFLAKNLS